MNVPQTKQDLQQFLNKEDFIIQTCQQISKDLAGLIVFEPNLDLDLEAEILPQLISKISSIVSQLDAGNLQQFIYKVDLKESEYLNALSANDNGQQLAFLIIKREAQKVFLRARFS